MVSTMQLTTNVERSAFQSSDQSLNQTIPASRQLLQLKITVLPQLIPVAMESPLDPETLALLFYPHQTQ